ncbi:MerR family transcriptional regulator [Polycladomyces subterraneus]|uniref:MerR family transcriptional regulator n=1 Tax=Polycladomyces subterraneus TaxID=1016997 RepID=A0ABT8IK27_9BACL|nr:MerR family transcriptional regulator [Polycladomyces subterraneus]MDN4592906.1 MerR family transcriptional regulator [Polycladomyces subterraneus]
MEERQWKIGELAQETGLTIRTLHYYDQIGLLKPSRHTESGHRVYTPDDVIRLQQILSLKSLGFSLEEIQACLQKPTFSPEHIIDRQLEQLENKIQLMQTLRERLILIRRWLDTRQKVNTETLLHTLEVIRMSEQLRGKYYTEEQLKQLEERRKLLGEETIRETEREWPELIRRVREEMEKGTPPHDENVRKLARRWKGLVKMFTGGDPGIRQSLQRMYEENPDFGAQMGLDQKIFAYIGKAMDADKDGKGPQT